MSPSLVLLPNNNGFKSSTAHFLYISFFFFGQDSLHLFVSSLIAGTDHDAPPHPHHTQLVFLLVKLKWFLILEKRPKFVSQKYRFFGFIPKKILIFSPYKIFDNPVFNLLILMMCKLSSSMSPKKICHIIKRLQSVIPLHLPFPDTLISRLLEPCWGFGG